jgi:hypothetical protein
MESGITMGPEATKVYLQLLKADLTSPKTRGIFTSISNLFGGGNKKDK